MYVRPLVASLAPLFATSLAHAQAPGEVMAQPAPVYIVPVMPAPVAAAPAAVVAAPMVAPAPAPAESVMARRWSIGLSMGAMSIAPEARPDDETAFAIAELALRLRATKHLELEVKLAGGREQTDDGETGDLEIGSAALAARFRFLPEHAWNWYAMAGFGVASVAHHEATDEQREDAARPLGMLGIGVERRFRSFALHAEARAVGIGDEKIDVDDEARADEPVGAMSVSPDPADEPRVGGAVSVGLSYYF